MALKLGVALTLIGLAGVSAADQGAIEIGPTDTFPIVITAPGSYVLTSNLHMVSPATAAIEIAADHVTLDLGGHELRGPGPGINAAGVYASNRTGITIRNGTVTWFKVGINLSTGSTTTPVNRLHDLTITHIEWGPGLGFSGGVAHDIVIQDVGVVPMVSPGLSCSRCTVRDVVVRSSFEGFDLFEASAVNCTASGNSNAGFQLRFSSLNGGSSTGNGGTGVDAGFQSVVIGVSASGNGGYGIRLDSGGHSNLVNSAAADNTAGNIIGCGDGNGCHQNYMP